MIGSLRRSQFIKMLRPSLVGVFRSGRGVIQDSAATAYIAELQIMGAGDSYLDAIGFPPWEVVGPAIHRFFSVERAAGRLALVEMLLLPMWGDKDLNSLCAITLNASTQFLGSQTAYPGEWNPDGDTGYADTGRTCASCGQTLSSATFGALLTSPEQGTVMHASGGGGTHELSTNSISFSYAAMGATAGGVVTGSTTAGGARFGIVIASREGGKRSIYRRNGGGFSTLASTVGGNVGALPTGTIKLARSDAGGGTAHFGGFFGAAFAGPGMTAAQAEGFSLSLKNLWETCTGLSLL